MFISPSPILMKSSQSAHRRIVHIKVSFIGACYGPETKAIFFTQPSVLNIFWMNIATSGVGKSQSRKRLIAEPLEYMMHDKELKIPDFEVCNFTRAGNFSLVMQNYIF